MATSMADAKPARIQAACETRDIRALVDLAASPGGFLEDRYRRLAWPLLLGSDDSLSPGDDWASLPAHRDEGQVKLDVDRSFVYYPKDEPDKTIDGRKRELLQVITQALRHHPSLNYFQGYHDIIQVLLLVLGQQHAAHAARRISLLRLRDFMLPSFTPSLEHLRLLFPILRAADPALEVHLSQTRPIFALPATLTLYAHVIQEYGDIARLFDFLLAHEAAVSIYLFAVIILSRKKELLEVEANEPEMLHAVLSKLPQPLDLELLLDRTANLHRQHPPNQVSRWLWMQVSSCSVLKTTRNPVDTSTQTLAYGERMMLGHSRHLQRLQTLTDAATIARRHGHVAGASGVAVLVAALAWYLGRSGALPLLPALWQRFQMAFYRLGL